MYQTKKLDEISSVHICLNSMGLSLDSNIKTSSELTRYLNDNIDYGTFFKLMTDYKSVYLTNFNFLTFDVYQTLTAMHIARHLMFYKVCLSHKLYAKHCSEEMSNGQYRNSGWANARVLVLCPTRFHAYLWAHTIFKFTNLEAENLDKLFEYRSDEADNIDVLSESEHGLHMCKRVNSNPKSLDYINTFRGDSHDIFLLPIKIVNNKMNFNCSLETASLIIASPIGLRLALVKNQEKQNVVYEQNYNESDYDLLLLSSIEILVASQVDVLEQQNATHLDKIIKLCNREPSSYCKNFCIDRLRKSYFQEDVPNAPIYLRQEIFLSGTKNSVILSNPLQNIRGYAQLFTYHGNYLLNLIRSTPTVNVISVGEQAKKISDDSGLFLMSILEDEVYLTFYQHFIKEFHSQIVEDPVLLVIPNEVHYKPVKKLLKSGVSTDNFQCVSEKHSLKTLQSRIADLKAKTITILVLSERFYYYHRNLLSGYKHLVFLEPPTNPFIFNDLFKQMNTDVTDSVANSYKIKPLCLIYWHTKYHYLEMERIVGTAKIKSLLTKNSNTQVFINEL